MRYRLRRRLIAGFGTALGLCAVGMGCQSAPKPATRPSTPLVTMGAPIPLSGDTASAGTSSNWTARAASPGGTAVSWRTTGPSGGGLVTADHQVADSPTNAAPGSKDEVGPLLSGAPEPVKGQPSE